ncbi:MAG TPA: Wzz/FepE/Etk N-terminal domain-containing protein [Tenuifilaceae bacterium]|nr:Wzz/FepE/Etk N-terminal domain-containing protein [Tenuifilaceae bacterium]
MSKKQKKLNLDTVDVIQTLWAYRKIVFIISIAAFVLSIVASYLITPKFKSTAIIFPPVANQVSKDLFTENIQEGITVFGETQEAEQFLQILTSRTLKDSVIKKLNLVEHWDLKPGKGINARTYAKFDQNINIKPTRYQSVMVEVLDPDPGMAAIIANTIVDFGDKIMRSVKAQIAQKALTALEKQYELGLGEMNALEDSLTAVMEKGVVNLRSQSEVYYKELIKSKGKNSETKNLGRPLKNLERYGSKNERYKMEINQMSIQLAQLRQDLKVARVEAEQEIPSQFIIEKAIASDKKATPKRVIIVVISTLAAAFFTIMTIIIMIFFKKMANKIASEQE